MHQESLLRSGRTMGTKIEKIGDSSFIRYLHKDIEVCFCSCGASIYSYSLRGHEWFFSPLDKNSFLSSKGFYGKTLGPIAGRYKTNGQVICHGGDHSLSFREFAYSFIEKQNGFFIEFRIDVDEDTSFYGNHTSYIVDYEVGENGQILVRYKIAPKEDTYASLSLHSYFCFDKEDVRDLTAEIEARQVSLLNEDLSIRGFVPVSEAFDFKTPKQLKETIVEKENLTICGHYLKNVRYPIRVEGDKCKLSIDSSYPSALIYLDSAPVGEVGLKKQKEKQFSCFVFEPEIDPSDKEELLIKANQERTNWILLCFDND